jgi:hypothetical protein
MLLDKFPPMTGAASSNRVGVVDGGKDQHDALIRGAHCVTKVTLHDSGLPSSRFVGRGAVFCIRPRAASMISIFAALAMRGGTKSE